jgi:hypothetical protein
MDENDTDLGRLWMEASKDSASREGGGTILCMVLAFFFSSSPKSTFSTLPPYYVKALQNTCHLSLM